MDAICPSQTVSQSISADFSIRHPVVVAHSWGTLVTLLSLPLIFLETLPG